MKLSDRQRRVLALVADGNTYKQIARQIGCAPVTVEEHVKRARVSLRAQSGTHAVAIAIRSGLI